MSTRQAIFPKHAHALYKEHGYSPAILSGDLLFASGSRARAVAFVEPLVFHPEDAGRILVEVHQVVRDMAGTIVADERVGHRFTIEHNLIKGMEVCSLPSPNAFDEATT